MSRPAWSVERQWHKGCTGILFRPGNRQDDIVDVTRDGNIVVFHLETFEGDGKTASLFRIYEDETVNVKVESTSSPSNNNVLRPHKTKHDRQLGKQQRWEQNRAQRAAENRQRGLNAGKKQK